jgi:spermidine synthase
MRTPAPSPVHTPRVVHVRRPHGVPAWATACFLASGAAGLLYEVVWSKQLAYLLGSSLRSAAIVVAAFLAGLALGARALGAPLARGRSPGRRYAMLEAAVAVTGFAVLPVLRALDGPVGRLYRELGGESLAFAFARGGLLFAVLLVPAALMGATLPVLVARCERRVVGPGLAWLYAVNTLGAVLGSLAGGFVFLPAIGLGRTTLVAAGLNLFAALWAALAPEAPPVPGGGLAAEPAASPARPAQPVVWPRPVELTTREQRRSLAALFAMSGFVALALQIAWLRLYGLVLGSSVYSFAAVLGVYLIGIALGSALLSRFSPRTGHGLATFAVLQLGLAASVALGSHLYGGLPGAMLGLGQRTGASWTELLLAQLGLVVPVVLPPCVALGALFPLATRLLQAGAEPGGTATGRAYALNTLGTIAGSLLTGFVLLPDWGVQGVVLSAGGIAALLGIATLFLRGRPPSPTRLHLAAGAMAVIVLVASFTAPPWDPVLMSLGTYRPFHAANVIQSWLGGGGIGDPARRVAAAQRVLFYREGINASVLVATDLEGTRRWLRVGGKIDASTSDMLTQTLLGLVPAAIARPGARSLIIGHGSGFTAAAALAAGTGPMDIVELEPAVIEGSRLFHAPGEDPLDDRRVRLYLEDARARLAHGEGRYGLIVSEPSNPWIAGVNNLFTEDFYRLVRRRLEPDGVFCQWLQLYELSPVTFHSMLGAFLRVFPQAQVFCLWNSYDVLLVASPPGATLSWDRLQGPAAEREWRRARLRSPEEIAAFYVGPAAAWIPEVANAERNTDDRPFVEYRAPRDMVEVGRGLASHHPEVIHEFRRAVVPPPGGPLASWPRELVLRARAESMLEGAGDAEAQDVFGQLRAAGAGSVAAELAAGRREALERERFAARLAQARGSAERGDAAGARAILEDVIAQGGGGPEDWVLLARVRRDLGDSRGSGQAAAHVLEGPASDAARLDALLLSGMASQAARRDSTAFARFREAQALAPHDGRAYDYEARLRFTSRDFTGARAVVERGLRNVPGDPALTQALQVLSQQSAGH